MDRKLLFVYGTLLTGEGNHGCLLGEEHHELLGKDSIKGHYELVSLGGFPGLIPLSPESKEKEIFGEVYAVDNEAYKRVERLEGYPSFYDKLKVDTKFGEAEVYVLDEEYLRNEVIESGNWLNR